MRNAILLILFSATSLWALDTDAQAPDSKLNVKSGTIAFIFEQIRQQTNMDFFYNSDVLDVNRKVNKDLMHMSLTEILDEVLGKGYAYAIKDNYILISENNKGQLTQQPFVTIRGVVRDEKGKPLSGASINIVGTRISGQTGLNGAFILQAPKAKQIELRVTFLGKQPVNVFFTGDNIDIVMKEAVAAIEEVVVTGFFPRLKEGFSGAATTISREELQKISTGNIFATISALDPGFKIVEDNVNGSNPNVLPDFTIRGRGSFENGGTRPLFILDGIEVSIETVYDLNVDRIESITLLKDASAAILYGSRAANGVVVIETLLPQPGDVHVSYTFRPTISFVDLTGYDLMNATEKLEYERLAGLYDATDDLSETYELQQEYYKRLKNVLEGVDTYWLSQPVRNSISQQHSLRIDGGVEQLTYALDAAYDNTKGVMKGSNRDRLSFGVMLGYRIRDVVTIQNRLSYGHTSSNESPYGSYSQYARANPYERIYDDEGNFLPLMLNEEPNPLYDASLPNRSTSNIQTLTEQLFVDWLLTKNLRLRGQLATIITNTDFESYKSPLSANYILQSTYNMETGLFDYVPLNERGMLTSSTGKSWDTSGSASFVYNKKIASKHLLFTALGGEFQVKNNRSSGYTVTGFSDDRFSSASFAMQYLKNSRPSTDEQKTRKMGLFTTINYIYDNRFFADISLRYDGSSAFGADKKYATFWSAGGGWNVHNEHFLSENSIITTLRIRGSYGVTGNQEFSAYQARTTYTMATDRKYWGSTPALIKTYGNPELKWQNAYTTNLGFDMELGARSLIVSFNYYRKITSNSITDITVAPSVGLNGNSYTANLGKLQNTGFDFAITKAILRDKSNQMEWMLTLQGAYNKNKILQISDKLKGVNDKNNMEAYIPQDVYEEGQSIDAIKAVKSLGIDPVTGLEIFLTKEGKVTYVWSASDKVLVGVREPKLFGNINSNLMWRNWNLNMIFGYTVGGDYYNQTLSSRVEGANPAYNADRRALNERWKEPGDYSLYRNINDYTSNYISSRFVQRENTIKLTSLSLSYDVKKDFLRRYGLEMLRVSAYANELFRISTIKEERGLEYPFARSYVFELKFMF